MIIQSVEIKGFWGRQTASTKINKDVTIFIGENGTGKTTFVNSISAVLNVDFYQLARLSFDEIVIKLTDINNKNTKTIKVINDSKNNIPINHYEYKISRKSYDLVVDMPIFSRATRVLNDNRLLYGRMHRSYRDQYIELKKELHNIVEVSEISVYRHSYNWENENDSIQSLSAVDERLKKLLSGLSSYQLKLETKLNEISNDFQQKTLLSLLYSEDFDKFEREKIENQYSTLEEQKNKIHKAFEELGIKDKKHDIDKHIEKIKTGIEGLRVENSQNENTDDVFAIPLFYRTNHILDLLNKSEKEKNKITEARDNFFKILNDFVTRKKIIYEKNTSELSFYILENQNEYFPWNQLSSGEKQLLIQFLEALLQEKRNVIFIADEPELSLHVKWQEKLINAIRKLNPNAQLIIATHSPDIVADYRDKVIDMEDIVH